MVTITANNMGSSIPPGWNYNALMDLYEDKFGRQITRHDVMHYGDFQTAYYMQFGSMPANPVSVGSFGSVSINPMHTLPSITAGPIAGPNIYGLNDGIQTPKNIIIQTKKGNITLNMDTGDITIPPDIGRNEAIRDFWLGFQEHYQPTNKTEYEKKIETLKSDLNQAIRKGAQAVAEKIAEKYGNEKFIMIKPEDLIRFIQET